MPPKGRFDPAFSGSVGPAVVAQDSGMDNAGVSQGKRMRTVALDSMGGWWHSSQRAARLARSLTGRRLLFTLAICVLVSTRVLFQPLLYRGFSLELLVRTWLDYLGECLLMGLPILVALSLAEALAAWRGRAVMIVAVAVALAAGTVAGAVLLIPYYDAGWSEFGSRRFWADVLYWGAIGGSLAAIHGLQQRAASAVSKLHQAEVEQLALAKQTLEARLQVMRAQIEPHFLFNSLANVKRLCRTDAEAAITMLDNLVHYLRAALPRLRDAQSTLGQEAELVDAYLAVLKIRFGARLDYAIDVPAALRAHTFAPMMLLTLAENAIKHGITPSSRGGSIMIRAEAVDGCRVVRVSDSGVGFGAAPTDGTGVGLANTRARLAALFGDAADLVLSANEPTGVVATITLPLATAGVRDAA
jgi:hypothetical protein